MSALRAGAQDYLVKGDGEDALVEAIGRAVARHRHVVAAVQASRDRARSEHEIERLGRDRDAPTPVTRLRDRSPEAHTEVVRRYRDVLEGAVVRRSYQRGDTSLSPVVTEMASALADATAGPQDVVDAHTDAVLACTGGGNQDRVSAYLEESRLVLIEVMGELARLYRDGGGAR